jgi:hypothetical protein
LNSIAIQLVPYQRSFVNREAELRVHRVAARREGVVASLGRDLLGPHDLDLAALRLRLAVGAQIERELGAVEVLALQPPAVVRAQLLGPRRPDAVDRQQVDLVDLGHSRSSPRRTNNSATSSAGGRAGISLGGRWRAP